MTLLSTIDLSAESLAAYDRLGSVAILLLVLIVLGRRFGALMTEHSQLLKENTKVMAEQTMTMRQNLETQTSLHDRMDDLLGCTASACPVRQIRVRPPQTTTATGTQ